MKCCKGFPDVYAWRDSLTIGIGNPPVIDEIWEISVKAFAIFIVDIIYKYLYNIIIFLIFFYGISSITPPSERPNKIIEPQAQPLPTHPAPSPKVVIQYFPPTIVPDKVEMAHPGGRAVTPKPRIKVEPDIMPPPPSNELTKIIPIPNPFPRQESYTTPTPLRPPIVAQRHAGNNGVMNDPRDGSKNTDAGRPSPLKHNLMRSEDLNQCAAQWGLESNYFDVIKEKLRTAAQKYQSHTRTCGGVSYTVEHPEYVGSFGIRIDSKHSLKDICKEFEHALQCFNVKIR